MLSEIKIPMRSNINYYHSPRYEIAFLFIFSLKFCISANCRLQFMYVAHTTM